MKNTNVSISIALAAMAIFLLTVLSPSGCGFNFLPYAIHMSISNGSNDALFIRAFDILFGCVIFIAIYWLLTRLSRRMRRK